jgi:hypothetical protein
MTAIEPNEEKRETVKNRRTQNEEYDPENLHGVRNGLTLKSTATRPENTTKPAHSRQTASAQPRWFQRRVLGAALMNLEWEQLLDGRDPINK